MTQRVSTQVLIVGGGPSGLAAAAELAHHGTSCVLVEPRREVTLDRPRAKTTSARTMELFRRWGVAEDVRDAAPFAPEWSDRVVFCSSLSGDLLTQFTDAFGLTVSSDLAAERGQQVPQPLVERVLRRHVSQAPTVETIFGARVVELRQTATGVVARAMSDAGREWVIDAAYVLGCDGANGVTRASCGIDFLGSSDPRSNFNIVFRAPHLTTALGDAVQYWVVGERTSGVLGRLDLDGTWWAIAPGVDAETGAAQTSALLEDLVGRPFEHEIVSTDPWTARMLVAERFRSGRAFLVGEAAHLNPPWGGHGYNTCVGDAVNLSWKLAAVIQGWGDAELLDSYEAERRPIADATIKVAVDNMGTLSTDLAMRAADDPPIVVNLIQSAKRPEFHSLGLVLGYSYAGSPAVQPTEDPPPDPGAATYFPGTLPGGRLPHWRLADGTALYDHLGPGLSLLGPLGDQPAEVEALVRRAADSRVPLELIEAPANYPWRDEFLLVRPDQHIAWRSRRADQIDLTWVHGQSVFLDQGEIV